MSDNYQDINMNLLHVMEQEAKQAFERGDKEDGKALCNSIFKQLIPALVKETKKNPEVIYKLIAQGNSQDKKLAEDARTVLKILKDNGVELGNYLMKQAKFLSIKLETKLQNYYVFKHLTMQEKLLMLQHS